MDTYTAIAYAHVRSLTLHYSSSFGLSSRLFSKALRPHIYAIYGLVRIADEIVDTYRGEDAANLLNTLETETYQAINRSYSVNPIVHAYALTAQRFGIDKTIIAPFFASMRMDLQPQDYTPTAYKTYIHGSAEVIGLMCLKVFCDGNSRQYRQLMSGAESLGSAYQKVNFLRDLASDYTELGRLYFPEVSFDSFDEPTKRQLIADIEHDFARAIPAIQQLPSNSRAAVEMSRVYYSELLHKLQQTPVETIKLHRVRITTLRKLQLLVVAYVKAIVRR